MAEADTGLLGFVLARDFSSSGGLFILYSPDAAPATMRVARFTLREGLLDLASEEVVIAVPIEGGKSPAHCGGGLAWDSDGNLLIGLGDNTPPQDVPPIHPDDALKDARRSAGNTFDLRGKILRITPKSGGGYTVPVGNLFTDPARGRPEIYIMGTRNPFRISFDATTRSVVWGDVGGNVDATLGLGPEGFDEIKLAAGPGNYGWPFFSGPNLAWRPFEAKSRKPAGDPFDPARPVNTSPRNTGAKELPPARPALVWYPTSASKEWPQLGSGGRSVTGGPLYRYNEALASDVKLPAHFDGCVALGGMDAQFPGGLAAAGGSGAGIEPSCSCLARSSANRATSRSARRERSTSSSMARRGAAIAMAPSVAWFTGGETGRHVQSRPPTRSPARPRSVFASTPRARPIRMPAIR